MPCVQAAAKKERDEHIRTHRRDVDPYAGVTDPVEILQIVHTSRRYDPLTRWIPHPVPTEQLYGALSAEDQGRLAAHAQAFIGTARHDEAETIVLCLAAFTEAVLDDCLRALVTHRRYRPSLAFRRAPQDVRDELIARLDHDPLQNNHRLLALAWIGDAAVVELFGRWRHEPPDWAGSLHLAPQDYAREAGWELTADGRRRDLYCHDCTRLVPGPSSSPTGFQAITDAAGICPWCGAGLTKLVQVAPSTFGLSAPLGGLGGVQVTTCQVCTAFGTVFGQLDSDGVGHWSPANARPDYLPADVSTWPRLPVDALTPAGKRPAWYGADQFLPTTFSQLGGHPTWVQDAEYPACPTCARTMLFLAQINRDEIEDHAEGMYYAFVCPDCRTTATGYQQT